MITFVISLFILQALGQPAFLKEGLVSYYPMRQNLSGEFGSPALISTNLPKFLDDKSGAVFTGSTTNQSYLQSPLAVSAFDKCLAYTISFSLQYNYRNNKWAPVIATWPNFATCVHVENGVLSLGQWNRNVQGYWFEKTILSDFTRQRFVSIVFQSEKESALGTVNFYVDGVLTGSAPMVVGDYGDPNARDMESIVIGAPKWLTGGPSPFDGKIRDLFIHNRALSEHETKALFDYVSSPEGPATAQCVAQVINGFVVGASIISGGSGYTNNPPVTVVGGGGSGANIVASVENGTVVSLKVTAAGSGYTNNPSVVVGPPPIQPSRATGVAKTVNGFVVQILMTRNGQGYNSPPEVIIDGGGGRGATAVATIENGTVTGITITNPGSGYTSAPIVRIASPPFAPRLSIQTSKVSVKINVVLGSKYQLEASTDLNTWNPTGPSFIAQDEELIQEFDVNQVGRYFRINQIP